MRVLVIEDERRLAQALMRLLEAENYAVDLAHDGAEGLYLAQTGIYDVLVVDVMLPRLDGLVVVRALRVGGINTPVLLLTAKSTAADKVLGLDSGADDYLAKPFHFNELAARLRALTRRKGEVSLSGLLCHGDIELNPNTFELMVGGQGFSLTKKEAQLLELLIANRGQVVETPVIIQKVWGYDSDAEDRRVRVYASFLRKKLAQLESTLTVKAVRGVGYMLAEASEGRDDAPTTT
jgi:DNA-binding response OmpR family regulator